METTSLADLGCAAGCVALTFDDGPQRPHTDALLDVLAQTGTPATFFVLGEQIGGNEELLRRMVRQGCAVEVHAWEHADMTGQSPRQLRRDIERTRDLIGAVTGRPPRYLRPPYGEANPAVLDAIRAAGLIPVFWTVDAADWTEPGADAIRDRIVAGLDDGAVALLHDAGGDRRQTVAAVPRIIETALERGLRPVSLSDLPAAPYGSTAATPA
jgi:peptidoglycan/xylan/chitin deacetylase (PgdA/CDA1 family)